MAFSDQSTTFPVNGQAFDFTVCVKNSTTGNPLTGGLSTLAIVISKDGGAFATAAGTVTEIGTTGYVKVSLTAADMTAKVIAYNVTSATANAAYATGEIRTMDLAEFTGRADQTSTLKKFEQYMTDMWGFDMNKHTLDRSTGVYTVLKADSATTKTSTTLSDTGAQGTATKGKQT